MDNVKERRYIYLGEDDCIRYDTKKATILPSDWYILIFTVNMIVAPTVMNLLLFDGINQKIENY